MSLVDYDASSSEDDVSDAEEQRKEEQQPPPLPTPQASGRETARPPPSLPLNSQKADSLLKQQQENLPQPFEKLPDASLLLNSPTMPLVSGNDHASRVAAALAESASRKREFNSHPSSSLPRNKLPRGNLPHTKSVPDTVGGILVPPQLKGRSNVATEDIGKLFVKKHLDSNPREFPSQS